MPYRRQNDQEVGNTIKIYTAIHGLKNHFQMILCKGPGREGEVRKWKVQHANHRHQYLTLEEDSAMYMAMVEVVANHNYEVSTHNVGARVAALSASPPTAERDEEVQSHKEKLARAQRAVQAHLESIITELVDGVRSSRLNMHPGLKVPTRDANYMLKEASRLSGLQ